MYPSKKRRPAEKVDVRHGRASCASATLELATRNKETSLAARLLVLLPRCLPRLVYPVHSTYLGRQPSDMEADHRGAEHRIPPWSLGAEASPWDLNRAVLLVLATSQRLYTILIRRRHESIMKLSSTKWRR